MHQEPESRKPGRPVTVATLRQMKQAGEKIACLTAYDASFTRQLEAAGVDVLLVGDSLGMVIQGQTSTLPVTLADMIYHSANVARARQRALIVTDMPFMSYAGPAQALGNAARLMREGGAHMVKIEGGSERLEVVRTLTANGIPVCAHLGLLPQSVHRLGGYRVQGRDAETARRIRDDARALQDAGAALLVLECVPSALAKAVTHDLEIPIIGIGAGGECDGQVLVLYDMLGITSGKPPRFVHDFLAEHGSVAAALAAYVRDVRSGAYPAAEHGYQ